MSTEEDFQIKNEYDDSNFYYPDYKDEERSEHSQLNDSLGELTSIKTPNGDSISVYLRLGNKILFCSGKYFAIEHTTTQTDHQKEYTGIVTTCHTCGVQIRGSLKVSSNFISHLKGRHPEVYQDFLKQKQESSQVTTTRRSITSQRISPYSTKGHNLANSLTHENNDQFQRNIVQFLTATNQSLNLVEDPHFLKLFDFPIKLKKSFQYAQIIKDECKCKQQQLANFFNSNEIYICVTSDAWSFGEYKYIALAGHWIDEHFQRQTTLLTIVRCPTEHEKHIKTILNDILLRCGLRKDYIVNAVTNNIQNYTLDFMELGVDKEVICFDYFNQTDDFTGLQHIHENIKFLSLENNTALNLSQLDFLKLTKIWGTGFTRHLDEITKHFHQNFMEKCSLIWKKCDSQHFKENFDMMLNGSLIRPNLLYFNSIFKALKQILLNKNHLAQICSFLEKPNFTNFELDYLDELIEVFEPLNAAIEFLEMQQNHFYGCFLPTLVTLKWRLTRLYNSKKLHYLQEPLNKLKEQLLTEFKPYYELSDTKFEAIIAAITYPPVKTRFLTGLQETVSWGNLHARNLLLKYGKDFHFNNEAQAGNSSMSLKQENGLNNLTSTTDFFDFGDGHESIPENYQAPHSLKLEIDTYLSDVDNTLTSLHKYPTIKQMFLRYNTSIPSPASVLRLFSLPKIIKTSLLTSCTHEQFENYIFYQSHLLDKS